MRLKSKLLFVNVPAESPGAISKFYSDFFGIPLARSLTERPESYHAPIDEDGIDLNVTERKHPGEMLTCYFGVDNLDEAIRNLEGAGGNVVAGPFELPVDDKVYEEYKQAQEEELQKQGHSEKVERSLGRSVVVTDPGGVPFGLIELTSHAQRHFRFGPHQRELDSAQVRVHERAQHIGARVG